MVGRVRRDIAVGDGLAVAGDGDLGINTDKASQGEIVVAAAMRPARHQDIAVALDRHLLADILPPVEIDCRNSGGVERGVEAAVAVVAHEGKVLITAVVRLTRHQYPAVALDGDALGRIVASPHGRPDNAIGAERRIEAAIDVVAHDGKILVAAIMGLARHENAAVTLNRNVVTDIRPPDDGRRDNAVGAEGRVEAAVGVVTHQGEVPVHAGIVRARRKDLAIALERDVIEEIVARPDGRDDPTVGAEGLVETAVGVVACEGEIAVAAIGGVAGNHDLAVALDRDAIGEIMPPPEVRGDNPRPVKGLV